MSILLVDDATMRGLHQRWMGSARTTDVLSFPQQSSSMDPSPVTPHPSPPTVLGDVAISVETAARRNPRHLFEEVSRCLIHGILHLAGFHHDRPGDRNRMHRQARFLERVV